VRMGIVSVDKLREARPYVIVGIFVVAAIVTPPDPVSQTMLALPMCLLYELGIVLGRFVAKRAAEAENAGEAGLDSKLDRSEAGQE